MFFRSNTETTCAKDHCWEIYNPTSHIGPETKLLTDLNRNIAQVQSSRWNYHYSAGTASVVLELPRLNILHFLSNEERLVNIFYTGTINKGPVYHCYRERFSLLTEIDKEISISPVLTNN